MSLVKPGIQKIIFVNGYLGFGSPIGGPTYWNGGRSSFVEGAKTYFGGGLAYFTNVQYGFWSTATQRTKVGRKYAIEHYNQLIAGLCQKRDRLEFITHSMGAAFGEGMIQYMKIKGWAVSETIHLNAFQAADIVIGDSKWTVKEGATKVGPDVAETLVIDYQNTNDPVINNWFRSSPGDIGKADTKIRKKSGQSLLFRHREPIDSGDFWGEMTPFLEKRLMKPIFENELDSNLTFI